MPAGLALTGLVQALNDGTVYDELAVTKRRAIRAGEDPVLDVSENLKFLPELTAISSRDRLRRPLIEVAVPKRAVVGSNRRDSSEHVVGPVAVGQGCKETLPQRIIAPAL